MGGTKTEGILLDVGAGGRGTVVKRKRIPTPREGGYGEVLAAVAALVIELAGEKRCSVGVCSPGTAPGGGAGAVRNSNTRCLEGKPFRKDLEMLLGRPVALENDANCFALAEAALGAGRGHETVFGAILGTGVGGGIVHGCRMLRGRGGAAGEWGHHALHPGGRACYCGKKGCAEAYLSGPALEELWVEEVGPPRMALRDIVASLAPAGRRARAPHPGAARWKARFLDDFGAGVANVISVLDPDAVVLGGGVSNVEFLYGEGRDSARARAFGPCDTPILRNELGDSAGVYGACMI